MALSVVLASDIQAQRAGTVAAERARLVDLTGDTTLVLPPPAIVLGDLIPALRRLDPAPHLAVRPQFPEFRFTWNSDIPHTLNDGPLWAGRGSSFSLTGGVALERRERIGLLTVAIVPTMVYAQNLPFQIRPDTTPGRSAFASPFHRPPFSADVPQRFGDKHLLEFDPGRSTIALATRSISLGATAENETWGPGIRNQLVMSANAAGIPRLFVATATPLRTPIGALEAKLITGALTESRFFDHDDGNDLRSLSGVLVQLRPAFDSALTIGVERVVYRPIGARAGPFGEIMAHSFDALLHWEFLLPPADPSEPQQADQIAAIFARWIAREAGFEVYGEWARLELPRSATELLTSADHTLGYTIGFQWAVPLPSGRLRIQAELTNLEQSLVIPHRPPRDFYTAQSNPHGYSHRGQVIGAAIGPGASSQWLAVDRFARAWQVGWYAGRIRWENDAMYRESIPHLFLHDVTLLTGIRGARRTPWTDVAIDATFGYRFNYLFQNGIPQPGGFAFRTVDVRNFTVSLAVTPR